MNRRKFLFGASALVVAAAIPAAPQERWFIAACDFANMPDKTGITILEADFTTENLIIRCTERWHVGSDYMRALYGSEIDPVKPSGVQAPTGPSVLPSPVSGSKGNDGPGKLLRDAQELMTRAS